MGSTGILVALIVVTIALTAALLVRPAITAGTTGKILAFVALCVLPGARNLEENPVHHPMMDSLTTNQVSCISSGCHDTVHNASQVGQLKMWRPGQ